MSAASYLADYHTHSRISPDARHSMTEMARAAAEAGLDEICFTDHVEPILLGSGAPREHYDWTALSAEFEAAREAWDGRLTLRLGIELGEAVRDLPRTERLLAQAPELDFIIGSIHALSEAFGHEGLFTFSPADETEARRGIADYLDRVQALADWGGFDVLGHLTLPLRYLNELYGFHLTFDGFEPQMEAILRTVIRGGRGIELNTNRGHTPLPDEKWLRMYRELGGEIITLGSDAHAPGAVGTAILENQALLRRCGFTRFCTFSRRQPIWHEL